MHTSHKSFPSSRNRVHWSRKSVHPSQKAIHRPRTALFVPCNEVLAIRKVLHPDHIGRFAPSTVVNQAQCTAERGAYTAERGA
jgi:hypothetical protein